MRKIAQIWRSSIYLCLDLSTRISSTHGIGRHCRQQWKSGWSGWPCSLLQNNCARFDRLWFGLGRTVGSRRTIAQCLKSGLQVHKTLQRVRNVDSTRSGTKSIIASSAKQATLTKSISWTSHPCMTNKTTTIRKTLRNKTS